MHITASQLYCNQWLKACERHVDHIFTFLHIYSCIDCIYHVPGIQLRQTQSAQFIVWTFGAVHNQQSDNLLDLWHQASQHDLNLRFNSEW